MTARLALPALLLALFAAGCGDDDKKTSETAKADSPATTEAATTAAQETDAAGCEKVEAPEPKGEQNLPKPKLKLKADQPATVVLDTNCGEITIKLDVKRAPKTASSVAALAKDGFYDGLTFHRILADFVLQGGDPLGNGQGGPGYSVVEKPPSDLRYTRGIVAMAKTGVEPAGTSGSQFFIVTGEDVGLPPEYALVGKVTAGFDAVDKIAAEPISGPEGQPLSPVVIEKATLNVG
jgi:cyclophilin family peptidyl-prolyl cis-trans isomerase